MKLIIAIVQDEDASRLLNKLMEAGFGVTKLATTGGFLRAGNTTLLTGVDDEKIEDAMGIIENTCKGRMQAAPVHAPMSGAPGGMYIPSVPVQVKVGGATVFVLDVEQFRKF